MRGRLNAPTSQPEAERRVSHLARRLPGETPVIAVSDYVRAYPQTVAPYLDAAYSSRSGLTGSGAATPARRCATSYKIAAPAEAPWSR